MAVEIFANIPLTTVSSGGTTAPAGGTVETWTVASSSPFPAASSSATPPTQFHVADQILNSEVILVTNISGATWTVTRGAEGTTPVAHAAGFTIYQVVSAGAYAQLFAVDWLNVVTMFGADPTGTADSTTAIQDAIDALPAAGGVVYLPAGTYKVASTLTITGVYVYLRGDGRWATTINFTGTGDCLRVYNTSTSGLLTGGGILDLTINGLSAGAGSTGLHYGDMRAGELRLAVQQFTGAGDIGVHFDNQYGWTEECHGYLWLSNNTQNVVFDVTAPAGGSYTATNASPCVFTCASPVFANGTQVVLSGGTAPAGFTNGTAYFVVSASGTTFELSATSGGSAINSTSTGSGTVTQATSTASFGYSNFDIEILGKQNQDGVVLQNGALYYNSRLAVKGNFQGTSAANTSAVVRITGTVPLGHLNPGNGSKFVKCRLDVLAECSSALGSNAPQTIVFNSLSTNTLVGCIGILDFSMGNLAFATSNWTATGGAGSFIFTGPIAGDFNLNNSTVGLGGSNSIALQGAASYGKSLLNTSSGNTQVNAGDFFNSTLAGSITVNLNPSGGATLGAAQRKTIIIKQAASGGPYTVTWPHTGSPTTTNCTVNWTGGTPPTMSTGASAVDVYNLVTYDGATWYGQAIQNAS